MLLNRPRPIQMERQLRIHRLLRPLLLERNRRLEHIFLRQIQLDPTRRRRSEHVAFLGDGLGEEFGHAVELGLDAVEAFGDGDGVVLRSFWSQRFCFFGEDDLARKTGIDNENGACCSRKMF